MSDKLRGLRALRKARGMSQEDLATALGVRQGTVSAWEKGINFPRASVLVALAALLECTLEELLRDPDQTKD